MALASLGLGGPAGRAEACHIRHSRPSESGVPHHIPTVQSQQILNPTSMAPQLPPLVPAAATPPAATITPTAAQLPAAVAPLTPSPVANPPAAETLPTPTTPTDVAAWHDTGPPACTCTCPIAPPSNLPVIDPPPIPAGTPPAAPSSLQPPAAGSITTPEPSTILSALVLIGGAAAYRRRSRPIG